MNVIPYNITVILKDGKKLIRTSFLCKGRRSLEHDCPCNHRGYTSSLVAIVISYLFNCGEGTQRLAHEHRTKLARLEHIFLTRTSWSQVGGLPGLTLTVQDAGVPNLTLHGAPGLDEIFQGMRRFVILKDLKVETIDNSNGEIYEDNVMKVRAVPIRKAASQKIEAIEELDIETDETDYYSHENGNHKCPGDSKMNIVKKPRREENISEFFLAAAVSFLQTLVGPVKTFGLPFKSVTALLSLASLLKSLESSGSPQN
uniref:ribonuclease Z n=1 Tax=Megaselia scalaris TaxID=36166 RepID=T1GPZ9_MEGSC